MSVTVSDLCAEVTCQALDVNLWRVVDASNHEMHLQRALRRLHAMIEEFASGRTD